MFAILQAAVEKAAAGAPAAAHGGGHKIHSEADLVLPDFHAVKFLGMSGWTLLATGLVVCVLGLLFGLSIYSRLKNMPVHKSMREVSELIYETCKTYLQTQGKFIAMLWVMIAAIIVIYFGILEKNPDTGKAVPPAKVAAIVLFSIIGILGSYGVAWFGIRVNNFANSRAAFASLRGKPYPTYAIPLQGRHVDRHHADRRRAAAHARDHAVPPRRLRRPVLHRLRGRRVARRRGAAHRRRHLHQDRRHRLGPDEDRLQHQGRRRAQPRRHRRLHRRQRRRLGRPDRRRLRDLRRHRRRPHHLHPDRLSQVPALQTILLVWIFTMRIMMVIASIGGYLLNEYVLTKPKYENADKMDFEHPLTVLVWLTSICRSA
jgi:hypothetical protein